MFNDMHFNNYKPFRKLITKTQKHARGHNIVIQKNNVLVVNKYQN